MFLHLSVSVILFTGGRGCYDVTSCYEQHLLTGQHHPLDSTPQTAPLRQHPSESTPWTAPLPWTAPPPGQYFVHHPKTTPKPRQNHPLHSSTPWTAPPPDSTTPPGQYHSSLPDSITPLDSTTPRQHALPGQQAGGKHPTGMLSCFSAKYRSSVICAIGYRIAES